jgi:hypothetical protein
MLVFLVAVLMAGLAAWRAATWIDRSSGLQRWPGAVREEQAAWAVVAGGLAVAVGAATVLQVTFLKLLPLGP